MLYSDIINALAGSETQQLYMFKNFVDFFGKQGVQDLIERLHAIDYDADKQLKKWNEICKKYGVSYIDFELVRIYRRYVVVGALPDAEHLLAQNAIMQMNMCDLAGILKQYFDVFQQNIYNELSEDKGQKFLKATSKTILKNIQVKLNDLLEGNQ